MPKLSFYGDVLPSHLGITVPGIYSFTAHDFEIHLTIQAAKLRADVTVSPAYSDQDRNSIFKAVSDMASTLINFVAFSYGIGLFVVIESFSVDDGEHSPIHIANANLTPLCTAYASGRNFREICEIAGSSPGIILAIKDLIDTLTHSYGSPVNFARAIEGIRHLISPAEKKRGKQWIQMQNALRLDEDYIKSITNEQATAGRHGEPLQIPPSIINQMAERSWIIMNRFFEYKLRGEVPLPISEFPVLVG